jgi:hypothetical protein
MDVLANISGMCHVRASGGGGAGANVPGERDSREDGEEYSSAKTNMSNIIEAELKRSIL